MEGEFQESGGRRSSREGEFQGGRTRFSISGEEMAISNRKRLLLHTVHYDGMLAMPLQQTRDALCSLGEGKRSIRI